MKEDQFTHYIKSLKEGASQETLEGYGCHWFFYGLGAYVDQRRVPSKSNLSVNELPKYFLKHPEFCDALWRFFYQKFLGGEKLEGEQAILALDKLTQQVAGLACFVKHKFFSDFLWSLERIQRVSLDKTKKMLAFKLFHTPEDPAHTVREIFVFQKQFQGVHFRGGKVARGGIRWCDTLRTFRQEVFGLFSAQMLKNTVVVPTGGKGGFVLTDPEAQERACYKSFIEALLGLVDNLDGQGKASPWEGVHYDGEDPYLVVAADKGTSAFLDEANQIAQDKGYWLGDGFASGGSQGYSHKELGITSRGAWESLKHHFQKMQKDPSKDLFSMVGVGGMSGDVFGNGLLLSSKILLKGAFSHQEIFLDPNPDPELSFQERRRLFNLPRSRWGDYSLEALSPGGQILSRQGPEVTLTKENQAMLGLPERTSPQEVMKAILRLSCDAMWLGGVGTYVCHPEETPEDIKDFENDALRIYGNEVGAKTVVEGANLGFTQRGRLDFAAKGGYINTDYLDNSGGVDCSDREVNLKILFKPLVDSGSLSRQERNTILQELKGEVVEKVLQDNHDQNALLSFMEVESQEKKEAYQSILEHICPEIHWDGKGPLLRPHLCALLSKSKSFHEAFTLETLPKFPEISRYFLRAYFPKSLHSRFGEAIENHFLEAYIGSCQALNTLLNQVGPVWLHEASRRRGVSLGKVWEGLWSALRCQERLKQFEDICQEPEAYQSRLRAQKFFESCLG